MNSSLIRFLHAVHSFELISNSLTQGRSQQSMYPFLVKFSLFNIMNTSKFLLGTEYPFITIDPTVMQDFLVIYLALSTCWYVERLRQSIKVFRSHRLMKPIILAFFTWHRVNAFLSTVRLFGDDPVYLTGSLLTLFEFSSFVSFRYSRTVGRSIIESVFVIALFVSQPHLWIVPTGLLVYRHWLRPISIIE